MMDAETRTTCEQAIHRFTQDYEAKYPKTAKSLVTDVARLLAHFDFPAAHWKHIRTTNSIESTFATVKLRTRVAGLTMAFELLEAAQRTWRRLDAHDLQPLVRAGVVFKDGRQWTKRDHEQRRTREGSPLDHPRPQLLTMSLYHQTAGIVIIGLRLSNLSASFRLHCLQPLNNCEPARAHFHAFSSIS